jgi:two-component system, LytTR family, sensor histidine kinase AlgZ
MKRTIGGDRGGARKPAPRLDFGRMTSINQNRYPDRLPDFLNLGVWLRAVLIVTALSFAAAVLRTEDWHEVVEEFSIVSMHVQPVLVLSLLALGACGPLLRRVGYRTGIVLALGLVAGATALSQQVVMPFLEVDAGRLDRHLLLGFAGSGLVFFYFHLRSRALSPALTEARLQALQARIRPHFLFNSITAVLSLVRSEPKRAEAALEDMADLFRVLMADNRDLAPLADEVELCRQYLDLEQLRLGERLRIDWHVDNMPRDAMMPPLVLQPLLENAVYHGIEPSPEPGVVSINIYQVRGEVHIVLRNPYRQEGRHHSGNKMALGNIRERLALHFDAEGRLESRVEDNAYQVHIQVPYVKEKKEAHVP